MKKIVFLFTLFLGFSLVSNAQINRRQLNSVSKKTTKPLKKSNQKIFLKIDGIDGEATDERHTKWIVLKSFYFDNNLVTSSGEDLYSLSFSKLPDISSVDLAKFADNKKHISKIELEITETVRGKQVPIFKYEFENVFVHLYSMQKKNANKNLIENIKLLSSLVKIKHYQYDKSGNLKNSNERTLRRN
ncbi:MAG TPA: type VI secretion system tube protein Hcp [Lutibacter sp.]|nr:type VI secretion system tube protein Hcp [Lutibacter sp.]